MKIRIYHILAAALILPFAGCSDSEEWTPGPEDTESGTRAYIVKPDKTSFIFDLDDPDAKPVVDVTVRRLITDEAITIPLVLESESEGITLNGTADFAAGQAETTVSVDYSGISESEWITFTLSIPDDQYYTYGIGLPSLRYSVIRSRWVECADKVTYSYWNLSDKKIYPNTYGQMLQLQGTFQFKMTDFFGSDLEMEFICDSAKESKFLPLINADYESANDKDYNSWYLYDEATQTWPTWTPGNVSGVPAIDYLWVYGYSEDEATKDVDLYSSITMVSDKTSLYGYLYLNSYINFDDGSKAYADLYAEFNLYENPYKK